MKENWGKSKILKAMMAGCLLFNNFSGLGSIINAAVIEQSEINSLLEGNVNEGDSVLDSDTSVDNSNGGNDSEEMTPILPGDGMTEGDSSESQKPEDEQPVEEDVPLEEDQPEVPEIEVPSEDEQPEVPEVEVPSEEANPESPEVETSSDEEKSEDNLEVDEVELEEELLSIKNRGIGSGLVQLWQEVEPGQKWKEGATDAEILSALQCRPNHILEPLEGGKTTHETYVNSCYVDDALYLGEDDNYYFIYVSGYEGKVAKRKTHTFSADLNGDKTSVDYQINTVAYFIPAATTYSIDSDLNIASEEDLQDTTILEYSDQFLDKGFVEELLDAEINLLSDDSSAESRSWVVKSPSYYANVNGTLYHYLTNNVRSTTYQPTIVGKAPEWMKFNTRYYSYDGIYFYYNWQEIQVDGTGAINNREPFYNYYQYLPFRSKSNYSANIFDTYVKSLGYSTIPQAQSQKDQDKGLPLNLKGTDSKLVNTGNYFYSVQDNYGINAGLQFSIGIHESGSGRSRLSVNKNNIFGMNATDNNPYGNGTTFPSVEAGINYHADRYLSWGYTDPIDDARYFGSHVGNKGSGMNVKYASDPFWGEKIAGWYYRFDKASGLKDYDYYTIGIKQSNAVYNVRSQATTSSNVLYQTKNKKSNLKIPNYPVLIIGEENGFYKIKTDTPIFNGEPRFNHKYEWYNTNAYIDKNAVSYVNHKDFKVPGDSYISNYMGFIDTISNGQTINNYLEISGWYINSLGITDLYLIVDGQVYDKINNRYDLGWVSSMYPEYNTENAGFNYTLNTNGLSEGEHTISVQAMGADGSINQLTNSKVYISNYRGWIDTPINNSEVKGFVDINGWYINSLGITDLYLIVDGQVYDKINNRYDLGWVSSMYPEYNTENAGFNYTLNTNGLSEGEHTISVQAMGADGSINQLALSTIYVKHNLSEYLGWIDTPINNSEVKGFVDINGWYINSLGITDLYLIVDGQVYDKINNRYDLGWVSSMYPEYNTENAGFNYTLNTNGLSEGEHTISVQAMGADGSINQLALSTIYVKHNLSEYLGWIDTPINNSEVKGFVDINGWYINSLGITDLYLIVDGQVYDKINNRYDLGWVSSMYPEYNTENAGFNYTLNTNGLSEGEHTISVQAMGADGSINQLALSTIYVKHNLSEYLGWIDTPINNSEVKGFVDINGWYINSLGITDLYLIVDGQVYDKINNRYDLGWVSSMYPEYNTENAGFNYTLNTDGLSEGEHTISVQAMGGDGGMAWLSSIAIYVKRESILV